MSDLERAKDQLRDVHDDDYCVVSKECAEAVLAELTRLRAEHDALVERLRGIDRWRIAGGRSAIYRQPYPDKPQHYEWLHTGEVIRAADLERVLGGNDEN